MVLRNLRSGTKLGFAVLLAGALSGCNGGGTLTAPTPTTTSTPAPSPTVPSTTGSLYGVVTEMTSTGSRPVEGVTVAPLSCARAACPGGAFIYQEVTTGKDGTYRVADLYNSEANYIWIGSKEGYVAARPLPALACEGCDLIVTVNGETRLDIEVVRR